MKKVAVIGNNSDVLHVLQALSLDSKEELDLWCITPDYLANDGPNYTANMKEALTADLVVFPQPGLGLQAKEFARHKIRVFGGGLIHDRLHTDPVFATSLLVRSGVDMVRHFTFTRDDLESLSISVAEYENKYDKACYWRHEGRVYLGGEELLTALANTEGLQSGVVYLHDPGRMVLKVAGCFDGKDWVGNPLLVWEQKGLLARGGMPTPEGVLLGRLGLNSKAHKAFHKLRNLLASLAYVGVAFIEMEAFAVSKLVRGDFQSEWRFNAVSLSVQPPAGFWPAMLQGLRQCPFRFFWSMSKGVNFEPVWSFADSFDKWVGAVRLSLPPYPHAASQPPAMNYEINNTWRTMDSGVWYTFEQGALEFTPDVLSSKLEALYDRIPQLQYKRNFGDTLLLDVAMVKSLGIDLPDLSGEVNESEDKQCLVEANPDK